VSGSCFKERRGRFASAFLASRPKPERERVIHKQADMAGSLVLRRGGESEQVGTPRFCFMGRDQPGERSHDATESRMITPDHNGSCLGIYN